MTPGHAVDAPLSGAAVPALPTPGRRSRPGRHLRPVEGPARRRSPAVPVLVGTGMVLLALFGLAVMHALLIGGQIQLDKTQREVAAESEEVRRLRLSVAELESPDRVLEVARDRLGMVPAAEVGYLLPASVDTGDDTPVRVAAAERPGPEDAADVGTVSPERSPSDGSPVARDSEAGEEQPSEAPTATTSGSEGGPEEDIG